MKHLLLAWLLASVVACANTSAPSPSTPTQDPAPTATPAPADPGARTVAECKECTAGESCVELVTMMGPKRSCVATAAACASGVATCDCMRSACAAPYDTCNMNGNVVTCSCIAC